MTVQAKSQVDATQKWYDDIAAGQLKEEYTGGAITGGADEEVEEVKAAPVEEKKDAKAAPAKAAAAAAPAKGAAPAKAADPKKK